ncbi:GNAT family N-acetyltransferase [Erwinia sp. S43]|uniref:GNAT family N-acetyltransferase n=1 Tax=Erwinia sp. S43 TaxID=2769339 RepID=UPI0019094906|nr:GNAT family N-acetyltransferase [Erwinia sp. S43]MBK0035339.1 GNAT family N-acetyltransferase [Erwinia sp. S43]
MQLTTERLILTRLQPEDWQLFLQVHSDEASMRFISAVPQLADIRQRFQDRLAPWQITSFHMLCLVVRRKEDGEAVGLIGTNAEWAPYRQAEVGYSLLSRYFGLGYGSEALAALCEYLFRECEFHKLKAQVVEGNWASRRVLEKNGFELEGTLRDNYLLRGHWVNDWLFGRVNPLE